MKKTLTVNLAGTVYHIDEDAYILLDNYLNNLRYHFRSIEGADEIVCDMEARIAELFDEYLRAGHQVVTVEEVEAVIARMGKPEELDGDAAEDGEASGQPADACAEEFQSGPRRRLFRNPDDCILGGVASGVAAYAGCDPIWIRLSLIAFGFFVHEVILAYLIAWMIIPLAKTATEKLQMRGEPVNVESIGKTVTDGFSHVKETFRSEKTQSALYQLANGVTRFLGGLIRILLILAAVCAVPFLLTALFVLFVLAMAAMGMLVSVPAVLYEAVPYIDWGMLSTVSGPAIVFVVSGLLVFGLPAVGLLQLLMQSFGKWKPMATWAKVLLILLWVVAAGVSLYCVLTASFFRLPEHSVWL